MFNTYSYVVKGLFARREVQNVILGVYTYLKQSFYLAECINKVYYLMLTLGMAILGDYVITRHHI